MGLVFFLQNKPASTSLPSSAFFSSSSLSLFASSSSLSLFAQSSSISRLILAGQSLIHLANKVATRSLVGCIFGYTLSTSSSSPNPNAVVITFSKNVGLHSNSDFWWSSKMFVANFL